MLIQKKGLDKMFDSLKAVWEKFSFTDEESTNSKRHPILSKHGLNYCFKLLSEYVEKSDFQDVDIKNDFCEIYYVDGMYEVTLIMLGTEDHKTIVSCHVFCKKRGKSRKKLYLVLDRISKILNERG